MVLVGIGTGSASLPPFLFQLFLMFPFAEQMTLRLISPRCPRKCLLHKSPLMRLLISSTSSLSLRVFDDPTTAKMWKASVKDIDGEILCVSQFTLMANTMKSNKPDFHLAMVIHHFLFSRNINERLKPFVRSQSTEPSRQMYTKFLQSLKTSYNSDKIQGSPSPPSNLPNSFSCFQMGNLVQ